jgi:hypothetical protein
VDKIYSGLVDLGLMPAFILSQFEEYESLINGQVLSLLDKIDEQIDISSFTVVFDDNRVFHVDDLQIYPSSKMIYFKVPDQRLT